MAAAYRLANKIEWEGWWECMTCGQSFTGAMQIGLAETWWSTAELLPEENDDRLAASNNLAGALADQGRAAEAEKLCVLPTLAICETCNNGVMNIALGPAMNSLFQCATRATCC
jgi:hypothetical protein